MSFHVVTGTPRSGSTLMCNLLNQRADTHASSTSALSTLWTRCIEVLTNAPEITSDMVAIPEADDRHEATIKAMTEAWFAYRAEPVVFDKSRGWSHLAIPLRSVFPDAHMIVMHRDPRDILASTEARHRESGLYATQESHLIGDRCDMLMSPAGTVGTAIQGIEDLIRRNPPGVTFVDCQALAASPDMWMDRIAKAIDIEPFDHDFADVESAATDVDALYRNKFPHTGSGKVAASTTPWEEFIADDIAEMAVTRWPLYSRTFGYG